MQRSNPSSLRALIIACVLAIILLSGLYLMKRMETNRLYNTIKSSEVRASLCCMSDYTYSQHAHMLYNVHVRLDIA